MQSRVSTSVMAFGDRFQELVRALFCVPHIYMEAKQKFSNNLAKTKYVPRQFYAFFALQF